jgi:hypothetical protein
MALRSSTKLNLPLRGYQEGKDRKAHDGQPGKDGDQVREEAEWFSGQLLVAAVNLVEKSKRTCCHLRQFARLCFWSWLQCRVRRIPLACAGC